MDTLPETQNYLHFTTLILAVLFFIAPLLFKWWKKERIELADLSNCALGAMALPNLVIFLYYLIFTPLDASKMTEFAQYSAIGGLVILFLTIDNIVRVFLKGQSTKP